MPTPDSSTSEQPSMLEAALGYAKANFAVFPLHHPYEATFGSNEKRMVCSCGKQDCKQIGKHPATQHGHLDATVEELQIRRWWKENPFWNIGLPIPAGMVAIDVDGSLPLLNSLSYELPSTALQQTGKPGGMHLIYSTGDRLVPPKVGLLEKLDLRGPGGYIVAAPSLHASGKRYSWKYSLLNTELAQAPSWLWDELGKSDRHLKQSIDVAVLLDQEIPDGEWDITLFRLASKLRRLDIPFDTAVELVIKAGKPRTDSDHALAVAKVRSAYGHYLPTMVESPDGYKIETLGLNTVRVTARSPGGAVEIRLDEIERSRGALDAEVTIRLLGPGKDAEPHIQRLNLLWASSRESLRRELDLIYGSSYEWTKLLSRGFSKAQQAFAGIDRSLKLSAMPDMGVRPMLIEMFMPEGRSTILFGEGSSGKTMVALHAAMHIVLGRPWLGRATKRRTVVWVDGGETRPATFRFRVSRLAASLGIDISDGSLDDLVYFGSNGVPLVDLVPALKQVVTKHGGPTEVVLILDHIQALANGEPEQAVVAGEFGRAADKLGCTVLALAHITGEGEKKPEYVLRPFGSVYWKNWSGQLWYITRHQAQGAGKASLGFLSRKTNDGPPERDFGANLFFDDPDGPITMTTEDFARMPEVQIRRGLKYQIEDALGASNVPMTYAEIAEATGSTVRTVEVTMSRNPSLFGRVEASAGGHQVRWSLPGQPTTPTTRQPTTSESVVGLGEEPDDGIPF